jgi:hypothetical protein
MATCCVCVLVELLGDFSYETVFIILDKDGRPAISVWLFQPTANTHRMSGYHKIVSCIARVNNRQK